ncbi:DUF6958 family protein [Chryseolinea soli]|uniref:Uncharacterized protein n=1 Tax=Chryseolinea soli TaxID=2321403 RepID=A0A385SQJ7_9BACT|nr:hypothetical protein [Chryseolinea soli]AYB32806.1 hypothetical protein D4L85_20465 [Chryseolinea soli]
MEKNTKPAEEVVRTHRPDGRPGVVLLKQEYDFLCSFILSSVEKSDNITLNDLLEKARVTLDGKWSGDLSWKILQVKMDLEAHRLLEVMVATRKRHAYTLKLTRQGLSRIRYENQVAEWAEKD